MIIFLIPSKGFCPVNETYSQPTYLEIFSGRYSIIKLYKKQFIPLWYCLRVHVYVLTPKIIYAFIFWLLVSYFCAVIPLKIFTFYIFNNCRCALNNYPRVPKKRPHTYLFFKKFSNHRLLLGTHRLLSFLLCESNSLAICKKKYLFSKKVISKASLKILEVNIDV